VDETTIEQVGISRRRVLTGAAVGAGALWAAPSIVSLGASAGAASAISCSNPGSDNCGGPFSDCSPGSDASCFCTHDIDGNVVCIAIDLCCAGCQSCASSADCPSSCACVPDTCLGNVCQPLCGVQPSGVSHQHPQNV
jgi:hypothetical protein